MKKAPVRCAITIVCIYPIVEKKKCFLHEKGENSLLTCEKNAYHEGSPFSLTSLIDRSSSVHISPNVMCHKY